MLDECPVGTVDSTTHLPRNLTLVTEALLLKEQRQLEENAT